MMPELPLMEFGYIKHKQGVKISLDLHLLFNFPECANQSRPGMDPMNCELRLGTQSLEAVKLQLVIISVHYFLNLTSNWSMVTDSGSPLPNDTLSKLFK